MNFLKHFGAICRDGTFSKWIAENLGDILIVVGLLSIPTVTFFVNVVVGFYILSVVLIILGILYVKSRGGD